MKAKINFNYLVLKLKLFNFNKFVITNPPNCIFVIVLLLFEHCCPKLSQNMVGIITLSNGYHFRILRKSKSTIKVF